MTFFTVASRAIGNRLLSTLAVASTVVVGLFPSTQVAAQVSILDTRAIHHGERYPQGVVASQNKHASQVGSDVLARGGNAVDAAVAVGFALAVVVPRAGNVGGGGFMMVYDRKQAKTEAIDYREMAPASASHDMFLTEANDVDNNRIRYSHAASGVPGTVAGLWYAHKRYGTLPWADLVQPAIDLAEKGFPVTDWLASALDQRAGVLARNAAARKVFYKSGGVHYRAGEIFRQPDLAKTLRLIQKGGRDAFYKGEIAHAIHDEMVRKGGNITLSDLRNYKVISREPISVDAAGYRVEMMPPPSSGGVLIAQLLKVYQLLGVKDKPFGSAASIHHMVEPMKQAYADRSIHLGDPTFYDVPMSWMLSDERAQDIAHAVEASLARPSTDIAVGVAPTRESSETTHYSIADAYGNVVSNTYTLNFSFGSGVVIPGYGFLMNNEMDDFSAKVGARNAYGLLGAEANAIEPYKRPLSSMTPTIVHKDGTPYMVLGSPGGSRIISTVLQVLVNVLFYDLSLAEAVHAPRVHHQWVPDLLFIERGLSPDTIELLKAKRHVVEESRAAGSIQALIKTNEGWIGVSDPRRPDAGTSGH